MCGDELRLKLVSSARAVVIKIGTNVVTRHDGRLDRAAIRQLADQIATLCRRGIAATVVSSGAIGAGIGELRLGLRPRNMPLLQATASVGQPVLVRLFDEAFHRHGLRAGQILLTRADFEDRRRYLNVRRTVAALHHLAVIPVVNENDSVAVEEIRFGDNDIIAALISNLLGADLLILLTVVEGLMADGAVLETIQGADERVRRLAGSATSPLGTGGMASKLRAAKLVTDAGQAALIANGRTRNVLLRLLAGEKIGTLLAPTGKRMASRKRWIGLAVRPAGRIVVDHGAAEALRKGGKSLLPIGITAATGDFDRGDVVQITDAAGHPIAQGLVNYDAGELERIKGLRTDQLRAVLGRKCPEEVIHRNNLTLTDRGL